MSRVRDEGGWIMTTALIVMGLMATLALATYSVVDKQQEQSANSRKRETAFNVAEAVMNAQIYELAGSGWPGQGQVPGKPNNRDVACTETSTTTLCPSASTITGLLSAPDTASGMSWRTEVHDNDAPNELFYSDTTTRAAPGYDRNGDGKLWVRAQATTRVKTRTLIALVRVLEQDEDMPHAALITGALELLNQGNKALIQAGGQLVAVRCRPQDDPSAICAGHAYGGGLLGVLSELLSKLSVQIPGTTVVTQYGGGVSLTPEAAARLQARAIADGTNYTTCPASLAGRVVYIDGAGDCPAYTGNAIYNSETRPGVMVLANTSLELGGTVEYHGIIYNPNPTSTTAELVRVRGNAVVDGGIHVDGMASTAIGDSHLNLQIDLNAYNALKSYGSAGIIQNTFREIKGS
jgi:type II secretory pathway pseudopilin PulG